MSRVNQITPEEVEDDSKPTVERRRRIDDDVDTHVLYAKQNLALVALLSDSLSQLAFLEVDMSGTDHLMEDAHAAVRRLCESAQVSIDVIHEAVIARKVPQ